MEYLTLSTLLLVLDWGQTRDMRVQRTYLETNIVLEESPTRRQVDKYFMGVIAANISVKFILPKKFHKYIWYGVSVLEAGSISTNMDKNIEFNFRVDI